jgi:hypothetical protein
LLINQARKRAANSLQMDFKKYEFVDFPKHWLAVGFMLVDPKNGTAKGFWQHEKCLNSWQVSVWERLAASNKCYRLYFVPAEILLDLEGEYGKDERFVKAAVSMLGYLIKNDERLNQTT